MPRQQVVEFADSVVGNSLDDEAQISFRVEAIEFRRTDQAVNRGGTITAGIRTGKQEVLSAKRHCAQCPFRRIVVDLDAPIRGIANQCLPMLQGIADGVGLQIEDDGEKLSTDYQHGLGLSLIDVYTSQFGGAFKLENAKDGVVLRASLKFEPVTVREVLNAKIATRLDKNL